MEMIDRYVSAVADRLPEDTREDVARELRANIEDMLPDDATENDVRKVLEKLGNPTKLSNEYRQAKRYLIGPALYDSYISILKLVLGIAVIAFTFLALVGIISKPVGSNNLSRFSTSVISDLISAAIEGAVQSFLWVTVTFAILERTGVNEGKLPFNQKKWSVDDLQPVSVSAKGKITRGEAIVSLVFTVLFISLFLFRPELFGWYQSGENGLQLIAPVFDTVRLQIYIPAMVLLAVFQFGLSIYKLVTRQWNMPLAIANTINNLALSVLIFFMFNDKTLFNPDILSLVIGKFGISPNKITISFNNGISVFIVIFVILCAIDSINGFIKCRKIPQINIH